MTREERRALIVHLRLCLAPLIRSDWGETDILVRLLRKLEKEGTKP